MTRIVTPEELQKQQPFCEKVREHYIKTKPESPPLACVRTYGCQQNVADSERIKGMLATMGFGFTELAEEADLITSIPARSGNMLVTGYSVTWVLSSTSSGAVRRC